MKINILYEHDINGDPHGCSQIRLLRPLYHPTVQGDVEVFCQSSLRELDTNCDIIIVERFFSPHMTPASAIELVRKIKNSGVKFIYTLDDNLLDLGRNAPWNSPVSEKNRQVVRHFVKHADGVIVSTKLLKERISNFNENCLVIPNHLDEQLFSVKKRGEKGNDRVKIGYMGTFSHQADLMMVLEPLREVLHEGKGQVCFEVLGVTADNRIENLFAGLPFSKKHTEGAHKYTDFIPWAQKNLEWDLAIAPLENRKFNYYKSDIKFLDYTLLGFPGVYSALPGTQLEETFENNPQCGIVVGDTPEKWFGAISSFVNDKSLRQKVHEHNYSYVVDERTLSCRAVDWVHGIRKLCTL